MLFQLREHVCPQDGAMLTFFHKWSSPLLVLSIDVSFVLKFFWKGDKNLKNWTSGPIYMEDPVEIYWISPKTLWNSSTGFMLMQLKYVAQI